MEQLPFQQLLKQNDLAIIENPLRRIPEDRVNAYIESFHEDSKLATVVDLDTLTRGGRLAYDQEAFISDEVADKILSEVDKAALEKEKSTCIWTESREIKIIVLICFVGSVVQGWVQGAIVGANQQWPRELLGSYVLASPDAGGGGINLWKFSATNAIVYFAASSVGALLCDPLTELLVGRRGAIFVAALFTFTASIGEAFTPSWQALFACRFLLGIGMGAKSSIIPVYASEISPKRLRGQILTSWQTGTALGIAISGTIALMQPKMKPMSWRFQISSSFIPALTLLLLVFVGSESPRWLIKKQRYCEAYTVLFRLRENSLLASRDLVIIWAQLQVETTLFMRTKDDVIDLENRIPYLDQRAYLREIGPLGYARRITQLFTIPRVRRATLASFLVMTAQQLTGVNVFAFLASTLFDQDVPPSRGSLWLYFGFGVANFLPGAGVVPFLYSSEIFPQVLREVGMAWASAVCWMGAGILDLCVPPLMYAVDRRGVLCVFAGLDLLALFLVWLFVPGTERQIATMEEMNYVFGVSTRRHVKYQVEEVAPWCVEHYLRRRKVDLPPPLYRYVRDGMNGDASAVSREEADEQ
ncbi:hypothetical protein G7Y79_00075g099080 [Physcia stellaris]|nr:hypothetical protein G7Y79_00075g099080 [Physcia stellaris]